MSGAVLRNSRQTLLFQKSSIFDHLNQASILSKQHHQLHQSSSRTYSRFFREVKDSTTISNSFASSSSSSLFSSRSRLVKNGFVRWYMRVIKSHPILTKSVTSAGIYTASDFSSQGLTEKSWDSYDMLRTLRMAGYGMLIAGPSMHFWFNFMSKVLPKTDVVSTVKKILAGQTVFGPVMTSVFFSLNAGLQGESGADIYARLKRDLLPTLINGLLYWPMCDFVTFKFVPVQLQPLMSNSFAYLWTIYLTYMASLKKVGPGNISVD